jgi:hypothetical protein
VVVDVHLVLDVEVDEGHEDEEEDQGHLEGEEGNQRPDFEEDDEFEFDREARVLHLLMKDLLAADWLILILRQPLPPIPAAEHQIEASKCNLNDDEVDSLVADQAEDDSSEIVVKIEIHGGYEQVEDKMEENRGNDDEHRSVRVGIRISHFGEPVHQTAEGEADEDDEDEDDVGQDGLVGLADGKDVDDLHEEVEEGNEEGEDQDEVDDR